MRQMKWKAFATDFDGTIATDGVVDPATQEALRHVRTHGLLSILVTGRELKDFADTPELLSLFDLVVGENGGVLHIPSEAETRIISPPAPKEFVAELIRRGIPCSVGAVIVATVEPHETSVLEIIKEQALELQVIFNKGAVMILPAGINKSFGLRQALQEKNIPLAAVVGVGDAENDQGFLSICGFSAAVGNALPAIKERVDLVTSSNAGAGVAELINDLLNGNLETHPSSP